MGADGDGAVVAVGPAAVAAAALEGLGLQGAVVSRHEGVEALSFYVLEGSEEGAVAKGVFEEGKAPAGEDAAEADFLQLEPPVLPHVLVLAV